LFNTAILERDMEKNSNNRFFGWTNAALLFYIYLGTTGIVFYGFAAIFPVMISSMDWARGDASWAQSANGFLWGLLTPAAAICMNIFGIKKTMVTGLFILMAGLVLLGTITASLWQWTLFWGGIVALGLVLCGLMPIQTILMHWFDAKRITVIGIVAAGAPLGGFLAQPLFTWLLSATGSWRIGWLAAAGFVLTALVACCFVKVRPEEMGQYQDGISPETNSCTSDSTKPAAGTYRTRTQWTLKAAIATPTLYFSMAASLAYLMPLLMITTHGILHFTDAGISTAGAASIISVILLGSAVFRFPAGWLGDRFEPRWIISGSLAVLLISFVVFWKTTSIALLTIFGFSFGCSYGACLVLVPAMLGNYYGPDPFPKIMGFMAPFLIIFDTAVPVGAGIISDKTGSYDIAFGVLLIFIVLGIAGAAFCRPPRKGSR
jgi:MFS family permease